MSSMNSVNNLTALKAQLERLAPRERQFIVLAGSLLVVAMVWWFAVAPALHTWRTSSITHTQLDSQLAQMQALANEAKVLKASPRLSPVEVRSWLEQSIQKLGKATLSMQGTRAQISFTGVSPENLAAYLMQARSSAALLPVQANWKRTAPTKESTAVFWDGSIVFEVSP